MTTKVWKELLLAHTGNLYQDLPVPKLIEIALQRGEGMLTTQGALRMTTGKYTGRSPNDKFIVDDAQTHDAIWWSNNQAISEEKYQRLYQKMLSYLSTKDLFVFRGYAGADPAHTLPVRVVNEHAWQNLFIHQLLIRVQDTGWLPSVQPGLTILAAPGCTADPATDGTKSEAFIVVNFTERVILIGGTHYAGEIKKSVFTFMNYLMPRQGILSMHCSANRGPNNDVALFFGLSGTGKTSLSSDPDRFLIGDDEHCWSNDGVFNVEGGCYAKCINLDPNNEPQIWDAIRFGTVLENTVMDEASRIVDYNSEMITENTRAAYPISYIPNSIYPGVGAHPSTIIFLTADAFGVLPPIAKLSTEQALYYFLSGYTSKLAGTERGITEPQATFSACFGAPFLPMPPLVYANLLKEKIALHQTRVYLINTGWQGGAYGVGKRISIQHTRRMVSAAIDGYLDYVDYTTHPVFNLSLPAKCPGVPDSLLDPQRSWSDAGAYQQSAFHLAGMFHKNFAKFTGIPAEIAEAGPFSVEKIMVS